MRSPWRLRQAHPTQVEVKMALNPKPEICEVTAGASLTGSMSLVISVL